MTEARRFIICFGALHAGLLAVSIAGWSRPEFRAWEVLTAGRTNDFAPDQRIEMTEVGDLGYRSWVRALQHPRRGLTTTDAHGFRNPPGIERPRVVLVGDSYVAGTGLSDDETLAARLGARLGEPVYSLGSHAPIPPLLYLSDPRFIGPDAPRVVVYAPTCRQLFPFYPGGFERLGEQLFDRSILETPPPRGLQAVVAAGEAVRTRCAALGRDNGLTREARFALQGALFLLRGHPHLIHPDGQPALVLPLDEALALESPAARSVDGVVAGYAAFGRALRARGARLVLAPVPDAFEVYPDLFPREQVARLPRPTMLQATLRLAREAGIEVVDLAAALRAERTPYVFHRDDSHWNPRGVEVAAAALEAPIRAALDR